MFNSKNETIAKKKKILYIWFVVDVKKIMCSFTLDRANLLHCHFQTKGARFLSFLLTTYRVSIALSLNIRVAFPCDNAIMCRLIFIFDVTIEQKSRSRPLNLQAKSYSLFTCPTFCKSLNVMLNEMQKWAEKNWKCNSNGERITKYAF